MAQDTLEKIVIVKFDDGDLIKKLTQTTSLIADLNNAIKAYKADLKDLDKQYYNGKITREKYIEQGDKMRVEITKFQTELTSLKDRQRQYRKELQDNIKEQTSAAGSLVQLRANVSKLTSEYNKLSAEVRKSDYGKRLAADIKSQTDAIKKAEYAIGNYRSNVGNYLSAVKSGIMATVGKITALIAAAKGLYNMIGGGVRTIAEFEQANANMSTILGKTVTEMKALTDSALDLGRKTEYTASQVTLLQTQLAKLGFKENQILNMQKSVLQFATAVGADLPRAAAFAGSALRAFGKSALDADDTLAAIAIATNNSALSFSFMETALSTVGPVAKTFGFTIKDTAALLGVLANSGFNATIAATATRNILLNLADSSGKLAQALGKPVKTLPELVDALKKLEARGVDLATTFDLTDKRSVAAFNTFLRGADDIAVLRGELENVDGELARIQEQRLDTIEGSIKLLQSAWEGFILSFSNSKGAIKSIIDLLTTGITTATKVLFGNLAEARADFTNMLTETYKTGGEDAVQEEIRRGLEFWKKNLEDARKEVTESGGLFGTNALQVARTSLQAYIDASNQILDTIKNTKEQQARAEEEAAAAAERAARIAAEAAKRVTKEEQRATDRALKASKSAARQLVADRQKVFRTQISGLKDIQAMREQAKELELSALKAETEATEEQITTRRNEIAEAIRTETTMSAARRAALLEEDETLQKRLTANTEYYAAKRANIERKYSKEALEQEIKDIENRYIPRLSAATSEYLRTLDKDTYKKTVLGIQLEQLEDIRKQLESLPTEKIVEMYGSEEEGAKEVIKLLQQIIALRQQLEDSITKQFSSFTKAESTAALRATVEYGEEGRLAAELEIWEAKAKAAKQYYEEVKQSANSTAEQVMSAERMMYEAQLKYMEALKNMITKVGDTLSNTFGAFLNMFEALGGEGEKFAAFSKALAIMQVTISQATAIANIVASSAKLGPLNILKIAASVATIIATIGKQLSAVKSTAVPKYAQGGLVTGPGGPTSDSVPIMASNGEAVMTARAVTEWGDVLSAINVSSGGNPIRVANLPEQGDGMQGMQRMFERALAKAPRQVLVVEDMKRGERRVQVRDNLIQRKTGKK